MPSVVRAGLAAAAVIFLADPAGAATAGPKPASHHWSFEGLFGTFDRGALQRGFQVYQQVCAACHGLDHLYYRNLEEIGFTEDQVKAIAEQVQVTDGPNDEGEMFERPGRASDRFKAPFPNEQAAPPDLSLIVKARANGVNYLRALLAEGYSDQASRETLQQVFAAETHARTTQYQKTLEEWNEAREDSPNLPKPEEPKPVTSIEDLGIGEGQNFNAYFPGYAIAMPPPLSEGAVEYTDGTEATIAQMSEDVTAFLAWASEPELEERKRMGVKWVLFLIIFTGLLYAVKRKVWADVH